MKVALIWASANQEKVGNKILKDLVGKWHDVFPVNPKEKNIEWIRTFANLWVVPKIYEIVNFVVRPEVTLQILEKHKDLLKEKKIWCQPWASDENVKIFLEENWFKDYIIDSCIMIEDISKKRS